jgi:DNA-binding protein H-NS
MTTYAEYMKQIADLQEQAAAIRQQEIAKARETIRAIMNEHGLTLADIAGAKVKRELPVKYRHPTDPRKTWTGVGRAPLWIAGEDRTKYLVK